MVFPHFLCHWPPLFAWQEKFIFVYKSLVYGITISKHLKPTEDCKYVCKKKREEKFSFHGDEREHVPSDRLVTLLAYSLSICRICVSDNVGNSVFNMSFMSAILRQQKS